MNHENMICFNCNRSNFSKVFDGEDRYFHIPGEYEIIVCENCRLFYTYPQLSKEEIAIYYPDNFICYTPSINHEGNIIKRFDKQRGVSKRRRHIQRYFQRKGKILDIGCATGNFLNEMKKYGWECYGVEPNFKSATHARDLYGIQVTSGYFEDIHFPNNYFDVVTLWDVLEHTQEPQKIVKEIFRILKPDGFLFLSLPNSNAFERFVFGKFWLGWDVPRHYVTFNNHNVKSVLKNAGFSKVKVDSFFGRHGVFMISLGFWLDDVRMNKNIKKCIFYIMNSVIFRLITLPIFKLLELINRSTIMSVIAQKTKITP